MFCPLFRTNSLETIDKEKCREDLKAERAKDGNM